MYNGVMDIHVDIHDECYHNGHGVRPEFEPR
jgi:hypothetical protein